MIKKLCEQLNKYLYDSGTVVVSVEVGGLHFLNCLALDDYTEYKDSIEIHFTNGSILTLPTDTIVSIEVTDEVNSLDYEVTSNNGWIVNFDFLNT